MKAALAFACILLPAAASAQGLSSPPPWPVTDGFRVSAEAFGSNPTGDTPTMRRQKLERAIALRQEVDAMLQTNGGELTDAQQAYVRRRARAILNGGR